jgi:hypothetical protein
MQQHNHQEGNFCLKQTFIIENNAHFLCKVSGQKDSGKIKEKIQRQKKIKHEILLKQNFETRKGIHKKIGTKNWKKKIGNQHLHNFFLKNNGFRKNKK